MADKKISGLTSLAQGDVAVTTDVLPIVDTSATETKKVTAAALVGAGLAAGVTSVDINSGSIDGTTIGANSAAAGTFTNLTASGTVSFSGATVSNGGSVTTVDINGGTIDGATIATSDITVGSGKTLNVSAGTLTLADNQISGDKVEGGTINAITINTLTSTAVNATTVDATNVEVTNVKAKDGTAAATIADSTGVVSITANPILSGGTANGVLYLNASKVATSGSALTFDGNTLGAIRSTAGLATSFGSGSVKTDFSVTHAGNGEAIWNAYPASSPSTAAAMAWQLGGTEQMRLTSTGLGIGTTSPLSKLNAKGTQGNWRIDPDSVSGEIQLLTTTVANDGFRTYRLRTYEIAFDANGTERMRLDASGNLGLGVTPPSGSSTPGIFMSGVTNIFGSTSNGITFAANAYRDAGVFKYVSSSTATRYSQEAGAHSWFTAASGTAGNTITFTQAMTLTAAGALGIGTTTPSGELHVKAASAFAELYVQGASSTSGMYLFDNNTEAGMWKVDSGYLAFGTTNTERARIDSSGNLILGSGGLDVSGTGGTSTAFNIRAGSGYAMVYGQTTATTTNSGAVQLVGATSGASAGGAAEILGVIQVAAESDSSTNATGYINFYTGSGGSATERARITSGGNFGIANTAPDYNLSVGTPGTTANSYIQLGSTTTGTGSLFFGDTTGTGTGSYSGYVQYDHNVNALIFGTSATERARITSGGSFLVGTTSEAINTVGQKFRNDNTTYLTASDDIPLFINRLVSDGNLVNFYQGSTLEGNISVSGNTVSYNAFAGSHWSQLQDGSKPDILRGTVMESINELCVWPDETNERLPKAKISDTAGSKKVYGVFMAWDNDWTTTNDMYVTAVGAFICRVNGSVTVQEGDLLESNGDGTARVQADDIIRSSTIGKVTSTVKTHEYDDGSYCVPTVLYCG